jgi:hypothetical protein
MANLTQVDWVMITGYRPATITAQTATPTSTDNFELAEQLGC